MDFSLPTHVTKWLDGMTEDRKAKAAAIILSEIDPSERNLTTFFEELRKWDATVLGELCSRAADVDCD